VDHRQNLGCNPISQPWGKRESLEETQLLTAPRGVLFTLKFFTQRKRGKKIKNHCFETGAKLLGYHT